MSQCSKGTKRPKQFCDQFGLSASSGYAGGPQWGNTEWQTWKCRDQECDLVCEPMWLLALDLPRLVRGWCNSETLGHLSISEPLAHILASLFFLQMSTELSACMVYHMNHILTSLGSLKKLTSCSLCIHVVPVWLLRGGVGFRNHPRGIPRGIGSRIWSPWARA